MRFGRLFYWNYNNFFIKNSFSYKYHLERSILLYLEGCLRILINKKKNNKKKKFKKRKFSNLIKNKFLIPLLAGRGNVFFNFNCIQVKFTYFYNTTKTSPITDKILLHKINCLAVSLSRIFGLKVYINNINYFELTVKPALILLFAGISKLARRRLKRSKFKARKAVKDFLFFSQFNNLNNFLHYKRGALIYLYAKRRLLRFTKHNYFTRLLNVFLSSFMLTKIDFIVILKAVSYELENLRKQHKALISFVFALMRIFFVVFKRAHKLLGLSLRFKGRLVTFNRENPRSNKFFLTLARKNAMNQQIEAESYAYAAFGRFGCTNITLKVSFISVMFCSNFTFFVPFLQGSFLTNPFTQINFNFLTLLNNFFVYWFTFNQSLLFSVSYNFFSNLNLSLYSFTSSFFSNSFFLTFRAIRSNKKKSKKRARRFFFKNLLKTIFLTSHVFLCYNYLLRHCFFGVNFFSMNKKTDHTYLLLLNLYYSKFYTLILFKYYSLASFFKDNCEQSSTTFFNNSTFKLNFLGNNNFLKFYSKKLFLSSLNNKVAYEHSLLLFKYQNLNFATSVSISEFTTKLVSIFSYWWAKQALNLDDFNICNYPLITFNIKKALIFIFKVVLSPNGYRSFRTKRVPSVFYNIRDLISSPINKKASRLLGRDLFKSARSKLKPLGLSFLGSTFLNLKKSTDSSYVTLPILTQTVPSSYFLSSAWVFSLQLDWHFYSKYPFKGLSTAFFKIDTKKLNDWDIYQQGWHKLTRQELFKRNLFLGGNSNIAHKKFLKLNLESIFN